MLSQGFFFFLTLQVLCIYIVVSSLGVYGIPLCASVCVSVSICVSCAFSFALFLVWLFSHIPVCLFILFYFIRWLCFLMRDRKVVNLEEGRSREAQGGFMRRETIIRIYLMKSSIFNKRKS